MKLCLITDTHFGVRGSSKTFLDKQKDFLTKQFFPTIDRERPDFIVHMGDLFDRKRSVDFVVANFVRDNFLEPLAERRIPTDILCGNHDAPFKNTISVNSIDEIVGRRYQNIRPITEPFRTQYGTNDVILLPWVCESNHAQSMETIAKGDHRTRLFGHLELVGHRMYKNTPPAMKGMDSAPFKDLAGVYTGHYHMRSSEGNIHYVGAAGEYTWSDFNCPRGFTFLHLETGASTFHTNPYTVFQRIEYFHGPCQAHGYDKYFNPQGKIIRVEVQERGNSEDFDRWLRHLEDGGAADVSIIEHPPKIEVSPSKVLASNSTVMDIVAEEAGILAVDGLLDFIGDIFNEVSGGL